MTLVKTTSPHIKRKDNLKTMLLNVLIALVPVFVFSIIAYPLSALRIYPLSLVSCLLSEFVFILIMKKDPKAFKIENILSASITAVLYAMCLPTELSFANGMGYFVVVVGAVAGIVLGKLVFGGLGNNIFNPAALGMIIVRSFWGGISSSTADHTGFISSEITAGATTLAHGADFANINNAPWLDMLLGRIPGSLGEGFRLAILVGMVYLLITKTIDWKVLASYCGTFIFLSFVAGIVYQAQGHTTVLSYTLYQVLSGSFLFGAVYMITDPVTGPVGDPSRVIFGVFGATVAMLIRLFVGTEGIGYSILFANMFACVLDYHGWASSKWKTWHFVVLGIIAFVALVAIIPSLALGGAK